jgi:hypothetical protein
MMKPDFTISKLEKPCFENHNKYQIIANCKSVQLTKVIIKITGSVIYFYMNTLPLCLLKI